MAYSPLGRGFLTGRFASSEDIAGERDFRSHHPRFQGDNFKRNREIVDRIATLAAEKGVTAAQLALAWVLHQGPTWSRSRAPKRREYWSRTPPPLRSC